MKARGCASLAWSCFIVPLLNHCAYRFEQLFQRSPASAANSLCLKKQDSFLLLRLRCLTWPGNTRGHLLALSYTSSQCHILRILTPMMCPSDATHQTPSSMTESSRTRSDSLEALGLQQDRKRLRLDSGHNDDLLSEEALTDSGLPEASHDPDSPDKRSTSGACSRKSSSPSPSNMEPSSNRPHSKVTINTRATTANATDALESSADHSEGIQTSQKSTDPASTPPEPASGPDMVVAPPDTISIHSSPSGSPEIQIAVIEDIDQDPAETNWTPVTRLADSALLQEQANSNYVSKTFPYSQQTPAGFVHEILIEIGKIFLQGSLVLLFYSLDADLISRWRARWIHLDAGQRLARHLPGDSSTNFRKTSA